MGKLNIYVPDELEKELRQYKLNISQLCQDAFNNFLENLKKKTFIKIEEPKSFGDCKIIKKGIKCHTCKKEFKIMQKAHQWQNFKKL